DTLIAALLNGCLEAGDMTEESLSQRFGPGIGRMVGDLRRIGQLANVEAVIAAKEQDRHEENLRRLLLGIAEDVRVVLVVLAERLHLMRSIKDLDEARRRKLATDTRRVHAPLANRLGVWQVKWELEDLALRYLEPEAYRRIAQLLGDKRVEREAYIAHVIALLKSKFAEAGVRADITGRPKHIHSIWRKMQRKGVDMEQIFDLRAVRILVDSIADCYAALGLVHGLWRHIPKEFDDYIATPKGNMYQSLHTAVVGPGDKSLEVQIRTWDMHRHAELGVAAHWAYKESKGADAAFQNRLVWMRQWMELLNEGEDDGDFLERFKSEFEPAHVYVLTPQSKVIDLPRGATPLDFAYAIHSEIGNRCRGAKVDGRIVPLNQTLRSGQTVEIITQKNATPSRDWLSIHQGYLKTARARNRVRLWFKQQDYDRYVTEGRALLEKELARLGVEARLQLDPIAHKCNFHKGDDLLAAIGRGDVPAGQVARQLGDLAGPAEKDRVELEPEDLVTQRRDRRRKVPHRPGRGRQEVVAEGIDDLMTHMGHCCKPVPGDAIVGYITRGRGLTIHRRDCDNLRQLIAAEPARLMEVAWAEASPEAAYPVDLIIVAADRKGLLRDISAVFSEADLTLLGVNSSTDRTSDRATMRFTAEVRDMDQLETLQSRLRQIPDVIAVKRPR
ncbi:MAG TPA: bifunctional (p)ppGpp synthetase/guanosine-3',5'-bis(diphosphate) 3'-pyrophosphohydrolase, partial [Chromatiaceae bacterium]|nr:bifunctional (p)ppGpp synthetase/guanosine-3',5'-bis(diphosphate) 3'-pyrophosphohydrolase [Chromatiaceae bacterium]